MRYVNKKNNKGDKLNTYGEKLTNLYLAVKAESNGKMTAKEYLKLFEYCELLEKDNKSLKEENWNQNKEIKSQKGKVNLLLEIIDEILKLKKLTRRTIRIVNPFFDIQFLNQIFGI